MIESLADGDVRYTPRRELKMRKADGPMAEQNPPARPHAKKSVPAPKKGRPKNPPSAVLKPVRGLRLSLDKSQKLDYIVSRSYGISAREWIEGAIEEEFVRLQRKVAST